MKLSRMEGLQTNVRHNGIKIFKSIKIFDNSGTWGLKDEQVLKFERWFIINYPRRLSVQVNHAASLRGLGNGALSGGERLKPQDFCMTATKMAVDLWRLQLHAGRSTASAVPRAPGTWTLAAASLPVQQRPLPVGASRRSGVSARVSRKEWSQSSKWTCFFC